jgi:glycosyltransferase involved in cell wall biosynthesis
VLSIVLPAHNEQDYLEAAVDEVVKGLRDRACLFEVLVCENGSTDHTVELAMALAARFPEVRLISLPHADYGRALRAGFLASTGEVIANFDVDGVDLDFLDPALVRLAADATVAAVVASKRGPGSHDTRGPGRRLVTATFSWVLRRGFGLSVSDTHGMKVLGRHQMAPLVQACRYGSDLFDTELLLRAERAGFTVAEIPVEVIELRPPRTPIWSRIPRSLVGLVRLRLTLWREARTGRVHGPSAK